MDPFFEPVRRRHPDVDIVVLPPSPPSVDAVAGTAEIAPDVTVAASLSAVAVEAERLWRLTGCPPESAPSPRWEFGDRAGTVAAAARGATIRPDGYEVQLTLRADLEHRGWQVDRPAGAIESLVGYLDELTVRASYAEPAGAFSLVVLADPLAVGAERAIELTRDRGERR